MRKLCKSTTIFIRIAQVPESEREVFLSVRLEGAEIDALEGAKKKSGLRSNAELIRFLLAAYASGAGGEDERV